MCFFINTKVEVDPLTGSEKDASEIILLKENPKLDLLVSTLNNIPKDRKVIIWSVYTAMIKMIEHKLKAAFGDKSCISVYGDVDAFEAGNKFRDDPEIKYFIANQKKAGTGLNLQFSSYQIFCSNNYSYVQRDQAEARQDRQGQKSNMTIIDLVCSGTIDETILGIIMNKKDLAMDLSSLARMVEVDYERIAA